MRALSWALAIAAKSVSSSSLSELSVSLRPFFGRRFFFDFDFFRFSSSSELESSLESDSSSSSLESLCFRDFAFLFSFNFFAFLAFCFRLFTASASSSDDDSDSVDSSESLELEVSSDDDESSLLLETSGLAFDRFFVFLGDLWCFRQADFLPLPSPVSGVLTSLWTVELSVTDGRSPSLALEPSPLASSIFDS